MKLNRTVTIICLGMAQVFHLFSNGTANAFEDLAWGLNNSAVTPEGFINITKAPYNVKNNGTSPGPNTTALQKAIDDAYTNNLAIFFPPGTYKVNNQLDCFQKKGAMTDAHVFVGSAKGARPKIVLADNSNGFGNTSKPKSLFNYYCSVSGDGTGQEWPAAGYNFVIRGLDFDLGNNPGAIAIDLEAAQGCTIQDCDFSGSSFFAAIQDLCGSGGHYANLKITGGKYAFYVTQARPMPVLTGITCINQKTRAFFTNPITTITIVGFKIKQNKNAHVFDLSSTGQREHLNLIDGSIEFTGSKATKAILNQNRSIYMRNVYIKNATTLVQNNQGANLSGHNNWSHIGDYNFFHVTKRQLINKSFRSGAWGESSVTKNSSAPPADLLSRHLWDEATFPHWEDSANVISIGPGTSSDDDAARIQAAIDSAGNKAVFLRKGDYYIKKGIRLKKNTRLFGVSRNLTRIHCKSTFKATAPNWAYMIITPDDKNATCMLACMALKMPTDQGKRVAYTNWKAGRHSMVREVNFRKNWPSKDFVTNNNMKRVTISGNGGGRWYGHYVRGAERDGEHSNHRMFYIHGTTEPISIYSFTVEYQESLTYMTEIKNASNVTIYGFKCETDLHGNDEKDGTLKHTTALGINNSNNIMVMGQSGLGEFENNQNEGLIEIGQGSTQVMIANADGGWRNHHGYYLVQNKDDNVGIKKSESGATKAAPAALYLKGASPEPIVYKPSTQPGNNNNNSPTLSTISNSDVNENASIQIPLTASDPDNDALSFNATSLPAFGSLNDYGDGTGNLVLNPNYSQSGSYNINVSVEDGRGGIAIDSFTLHVNNVNRKPNLPSIGDVIMNEGAVQSISVVASDPDGDSITLTVTGLPNYASWLDNGDGTGTIQLQPDYNDSGPPVTISINANDGNGGNRNQTFQVTVNHVNQPPVIASIAPQEVEEGCHIAVPITATDPDGDPIAITAPNLPEFATLINNQNNSGLLLVEPGLNNKGTFTINISASDGKEIVTAGCVVHVIDAAIVIYENDFSSDRLAADFSGAINSFTVSGGNLQNATPNVYKSIYLNNSFFSSHQ